MLTALFFEIFKIFRLVVELIFKIPSKVFEICRLVIEKFFKINNTYRRICDLGPLRAE